jgi:hypothetical protein
MSANFGRVSGSAGPPRPLVSKLDRQVHDHDRRILPIVNPAFVHVVPYAVSLTSKLLFGVAAATTFRWQVASELQPIWLRRK